MAELICSMLEVYMQIYTMSTSLHMHGQFSPPATLEIRNVDVRWRNTQIESLDSTSSLCYLLTPTIVSQ